MNREKSINILELNDLNECEINMKIIKKQYHRLSLLYHPDKNNNTVDSKRYFQEINEAYEFMKNIYENNYNINSDNDDTNVFDNMSMSFSHMLKLFIQGFFDSQNIDAIHKIIIDIMNNFETISLKIFDNLDKETCLTIYCFLIKHKFLLHLSQEKIDLIREFILKKYNNVSYYILNPTLHDLFENNVYKLNINDEIYIVPLWYNEMQFEIKNADTSVNEIFVTCNPILPPNVDIDEYNNIIIQHDVSFSIIYDLIKNNETYLEVNLNPNLIFNIELDKLFMKKTQNYVLQGEGISIIKDDIYDVDEKSNIIITLKLI